jgi:hypothetical protein
MDAALSGAGFVDRVVPATVTCLELDSYDNCTKCLTGYFLTKGRCCKDGEFWTGTVCSATAIANCSAADATSSTDKCTACSGSNILFKIDKPSATATSAATCFANLSD